MSVDQKTQQLVAAIVVRMGNRAPPSELIQKLDGDWLADLKGEPEHVRAAGRLHELQRLLDDAERHGLATYAYDAGGGLKFYYATEKGRKLVGG